MNKRRCTRDDFEKLIVDKLPDVFARLDVPKLLGGLISVSHLQNLESATGKPRSFLMGGKAYFNKADFVEWAEEHYHVERDGTEGAGAGVSEGEGAPAEARQGVEGAEGRQGE